MQAIFTYIKSKIPDAALHSCILCFVSTSLRHQPYQLLGSKHQHAEHQVAHGPAAMGSYFDDTIDDLPQIIEIRDATFANHGQRAGNLSSMASI
jgi:hypothetical protein